MSLVHRTVCHCDECGHEWIAEQERLPARCPSRKCRRTTWNHAEGGVQAVADFSEEKPIKPRAVELERNRVVVQRQKVVVREKAIARDGRCKMHGQPNCRLLTCKPSE